jgi:uncharacterized membrane protein YhaH (DUF805 family)
MISRALQIIYGIFSIIFLALLVLDALFLIEGVKENRSEVESIVSQVAISVVLLWAIYLCIRNLRDVQIHRTLLLNQNIAISAIILTLVAAEAYFGSLEDLVYGIMAFPFILTVCLRGHVTSKAIFVVAK